MAKYRPIFTKIWDDPDFEELKPTEKLIFIYLCTNPSTTESGIYPISIKRIADCTKVVQSRVKSVIDDGLLNIIYDNKNHVVFIKNFYRYNGRGNPQLLTKSIINDFTNIKTSLWDDFIKTYPEFSKDLSKVSIPNPNPNPKPNPILNPNQNKEENINLNKEKKSKDRSSFSQKDKNWARKCYEINGTGCPSARYGKYTEPACKYCQDNLRKG